MTQTTAKILPIYERFPVATWAILVLISTPSSYALAWEGTDGLWLKHAGIICAIAMCVFVYCNTSQRLLANQQRALHKCLVWVVLIKAIISLLGLATMASGGSWSAWVLSLDVYAGILSLGLTKIVIDPSVLFFFHFLATLIDACLHSIVVWVAALLLYAVFSRKATEYSQSQKSR